jgi:predicted nucleotidyltransferase
MRLIDASVQAKLRAALEQNSDVPAAYLFGSAAADEPVLQRVDTLKKESLEAFCGD